MYPRRFPARERTSHGREDPRLCHHRHRHGRPSTASGRRAGRWRSTTTCRRRPGKLILEKVRSGIDALITTLRDRIDEEVFAAGAAAGLRVVAQDAVGFDNIDREAANRHRIPFSNTARRPHRRHRRVRLLHARGGGPQALPGRGAGPREQVEHLAPLPALARRRGLGPDPRGHRHGPHRQERHQQGGGLRHGRPVSRPDLRGARLHRGHPLAHGGAPPGAPQPAPADDRVREPGGRAAPRRLRLTPRAPDPARDRGGADAAPHQRGAARDDEVHRLPREHLAGAGGRRDGPGEGAARGPDRRARPSTSSRPSPFPRTARCATRSSAGSCGCSPTPPRRRGPRASPRTPTWGWPAAASRR